MIRTGRLIGLAGAALMLGAAAPATLGPPVTGSMYNGNNAHSPRLAATQPAHSGTSPAAQNAGTGATGADLGGGHNASAGGGN